MTVIMLLLMVYSLTGGFLHEALGLAILVLFAAHKIFNLKWIAAITKKIFGSGTDGLTTARYITDAVLLVLMIITAFSGILISNYLLTGISAHKRHLWVNTHNISAYSMFIVVSVHIGLHWSFIMAAFGKMLGLKDNMLRKSILRICAAALAAFGIRAHFNQEFLIHFIPQTYCADSQTKKRSEADTAIDSIALSSSGQPQLTQLRGGHHGRPGDEQQDTTLASPTFKDGETPTLEEYLGKLHCTGCGKHCLLTSPQCGKGMEKARQAESEYKTLYGSSEGDHPRSENEIVSDVNGGQPNKLFTTMIPIMSLYICGTHYAVKFAKRKRK